jgi:hypothetical protein
MSSAITAPPTTASLTLSSSGWSAAFLDVEFAAQRSTSPLIDTLHQEHLPGKDP